MLKNNNNEVIDLCMGSVHWSHHSGTIFSFYNTVLRIARYSATLKIGINFSSIN